MTTGIDPKPNGYSKAAIKFWNWQRSMIGKSCKGKKCPHLGTTMQEVNGQLVCPLHDLRGSLKTEKIIKHPMLKK